MSRGGWSAVAAGLDLTQWAWSGGGETWTAIWFATTITAVGCWLTCSTMADRWLRGDAVD